MPHAGLQARRACQILAHDKVGSGYLVSGNLVLTARHVVCGADQVTARFVDESSKIRQVTGQVAWADGDSEGLDLAVVRLTESFADVAPVAYGRLTRRAEYEAVGFPLWKRRETSPGMYYREAHHAEGRITPFSNMRSGTLELTVDEPAPNQRQSPWEGMSGAVVFADGLLVGVVCEHHRDEGLKHLTARPVEHWYSLDDRQHLAELCRLLGLPEASALTQVGQIPVSLDAPRGLPRDISSFTGRTGEFERLVSMLDGTGGVVLAVHAVGGMAGVGKTAFATYAAHRLADRFVDGQMFLELHGHTPGQAPLSVSAALDVLLAYDRVSPAELPETVEGKQLLWRTRTAGRRMLLVLDDAVDVDQVAPLLPASPRTLVLVTSRRRLIGLGGAVPLSLDVLYPDQAAELLVRTAARADLDVSDPDIQVLAALCGHLPLALTLIGALLADSSAADLVDDFDKADSRLEVLDTAERVMATALELSRRDLTSDEQQLFALLGVHPGTEYEAGAAAALLDVGIGAARRLLARMEEHRLLEGTATRGRYRMHDLTREYARSLAITAEANDIQKALDRLYGYYQLTNVADKATAAHNGRQPLDHELRRTWARTERDNLLACIRQADRHHRPHNVIALTAAIAPALEADGPWNQAITLHAHATALAKTTDTAALAAALNNLGCVQRRNGQHGDAIGSHTRALKLYEKLDDLHGQADTQTKLGRAVYQAGDRSGAIRVYARALQSCRELGDRGGQATALHDLGNMRSWSDDYVGAAEHYQQALELYREIGDRRGQATALNDLGSIQRLTGDYVEAAEYLQQALELGRQLGERRDQADTLNELGIVQRLTGDYAEAAERHRQAFELYGQLDDRFGQARVLHDLGHLRRMTGEYAEAAAHYQQTLELCRRLGYREGQVGALVGLGSLRRRSGDYVEAAKHLQRALELCQQLPDRYNPAVALDELGDIRFATGDYVEAAENYQQALELFREIGDRRGQASALNRLGDVCYETRYFSEAFERHQQALELYRQLDNRDGQASALNGLGNARAMTGACAEAVEYQKRALELYRQLDNRLGQADTLNYLGAALARLRNGDCAEADNCQYRALELYRQLDNREGQARALNELGVVRHRRGDYAEAVEYHQQALELYIQLDNQLGQAGTLNKLGECRRSEGHTGQAAVLFRQALEIYRALGLPHAEKVAGRLASLG
ncbi:tetratricopeptide repeat protein [Catenulispora rubra]|uniref:tetratricopeptide repeat protein n=1 Tax=Catenulispora rubra TaxID=280293 RepID=UPI0018926DDF|nr:tetratricopeptide repeat protein [Catenulispora rubra]